MFVYLKSSGSSSVILDLSKQTEKMIACSFLQIHPIWYIHTYILFSRKSLQLPRQNYSPLCFLDTSVKMRVSSGYRCCQISENLFSYNFIYLFPSELYLGFFANENLGETENMKLHKTQTTLIII